MAAMLVKISEALRRGDESVSLWGKPDTTRDFMFVEDVAACVADLLYADSGYVNVGSGLTTSMSEVAEAICRALSYGGTLEWDASKPVGIEERSLDVRHLSRFTPTQAVSMDEGIARTVAAEKWLQTLVSAPL